ncbi:Delta endotoxin [Fusarium beomiforme]|uniref:Delta endotoxin n=1 Tax=Fusarium beomiforme TaxID=44412 RepID=A0A9P5ASL2_9HYPO|nr:Delta endotoxin [Fusarium beomiforme]
MTSKSPKVERYVKIAATAGKAAQSGEKIKFGDWSNENGQYLTAILAVGLDLIPVLGPALSSLALVSGYVMFPPEAKDPWSQLRAPVENLIGEKITDYHVKILQGRADGLQANSDAFRSVWNSYSKSPASERKRHAETLREHYVAFLSVLRTVMPDFQTEAYSVPALPEFDLVAILHLTLLADGIKHGVEWGFNKDFITETLKPEFHKLTGSGKGPRSLSTRSDSASMNTTTGITQTELDILRGAIEEGDKSGWPPTLLDSWKEAYADLTVESPRLARRSLMDYPSYAKQTYEQGRKLVKPYESKWEETHEKEALLLRAISDYDATMFSTVLAHAEFWPCITGEVEMSAESWEIVGREIYSGPFGRYAEYAKWSTSEPPAVTPRQDNITQIVVRAWNDIDGFGVKRGEEWDFWQGSKVGGAENWVNLGDDEYIISVDVGWGHKIGHLKFVSNKRDFGPYGISKNAKFSDIVNHTGYGLTSMYMTHFGYAEPTGIEGIFFGFRPLLSY